MAVVTRYLMDSVLPHVPTRQWVLSLPHPLRYKLAYDHELCTAVHRALAGAIRCHTRRVARSRGAHDAQTGAVTFVQRYGSALNLNVHFHLIALDGWFARGIDGLLKFEHAPRLTQQEVEALVLDVQARVMRLLDSRGLLEMGEGDALTQDAPALAACYDGAVRQRVGLGPGRGRPVMKLGVRLADYLATQVNASSVAAGCALRSTALTCTQTSPSVQCSESASSSSSNTVHGRRLPMTA